MGENPQSSTPSKQTLDRMKPSKEIDGYNLSGSDYDAFVTSFRASRVEKDARWAAEKPVENRQPTIYRRVGQAAMNLFERQSIISASPDQTLPEGSNSDSTDTSATGNSYQLSNLTNLINRSTARVSDALESRASNNAYKMNDRFDEKAVQRRKKQAGAKQRAEKRSLRTIESGNAKIEHIKRREIRRAAGKAAIAAARLAYLTTRRELSEDAKTF